jgi:pimeloyl-ACP methyl ester carboxylesterase
MNNNDIVERRFFDIAGSTLSVIDRGDGPAVLLGHGYLWDWRMWQPQIEALQKRFRLIVPEMWGHGRSGVMPGGTQSLADVAAQMLALMDALEIEEFTVIGSSMGGMWGAHLAALAPKRVHGLAVLNSYLGEEPLTNRQTYFGMLDQVEREGRVPDSIIANIMPLFFAPTTLARSPGLGTQLRQQVAEYDGERLRQSIVPLGRLIFGREDAMHILDRINASILVLAGRQDRSRPFGESVKMAERLGTSAHILDDCGHSATLEQPETVNALLAGFLEAIN